MQRYEKSDARLAALLDAIRDGCVSALGETLTGVYVHGSVAFGCFAWDRSDIDFLVVVRGAPTRGQKKALADFLLGQEARAPSKGFEMSVVSEEVCLSFVYPTPFLLHYSRAYTQAYRADFDGVCARMPGADYDLAAHFAVTRATGFPLMGKPVEEVFAPVPRAAYLDSIMRDVADAEADILSDPVYMSLNLCRVLYALRFDKPISKLEGGRWGSEALPAPLRPVAHWALERYQGGADAVPDACALQGFAHGMLMLISDQNAVNAPSIEKSAPVVKPAVSPARYTTMD
ncbi:MAG: DUF4111 domain-containing protein [Clostridiales bacterium]|nr:DUF4111 domain-containing protein [Clostridiales bacterium]